ncbi:Proteasome subunit alpha, bacterial [hydrothermal vent metagenome]|uniref:Proteasome subunit alpha, bacterial n=1 Tax=hydrothermal vent metagenome TaxID=652676 RepID=A0A3B1DBG2_9ZZZZ
MSMPYYVSPEQMMQDKAEYARKGISRGRSTIAMEYKEGMLLFADNASSLNKISEIYDRIAFVGAGKYSEFEHLRKAGIRHADMTGYVYSREDVTARSLANAYSQTIGSVFSQEAKPLEIEILVVELGEHREENGIYRIQFDGSIHDEKSFAVVGGNAEALSASLSERYVLSTLKDALQLCRKLLSEGEEEKSDEGAFEVAVLDRSKKGRLFRRINKKSLEKYFKSQ